MDWPTVNQWRLIIPHSRLYLATPFNPLYEKLMEKDLSLCITLHTKDPLSLSRSVHIFSVLLRLNQQLLLGTCKQTYKRCSLAFLKVKQIVKVNEVCVFCERNIVLWCATFFGVGAKCVMVVIYTSRPKQGANTVF